jgi:hypothetical protein
MRVPVTTHTGRLSVDTVTQYFLTIPAEQGRQLKMGRLIA